LHNAFSAQVFLIEIGCSFTMNRRVAVLGKIESGKDYLYPSLALNFFDIGYEILRQLGSAVDADFLENIIYMIFHCILRYKEFVLDLFIRFSLENHIDYFLFPLRYLITGDELVLLCLVHFNKRRAAM